ncbi:AfsR/SARP family transcriptional regulator [Streptomyces uncialis]|uniref:AfsR/SARP family transcriptional regulator n=1 Tax=Streptomyces uncialis TaxID=1048205 RepID=UPI00365187BD
MTPRSCSSSIHASAHAEPGGGDGDPARGECARAAQEETPVRTRRSGVPGAARPSGCRTDARKGFLRVAGDGRSRNPQGLRNRRRGRRAVPSPCDRPDPEDRTRDLRHQQGRHQVQQYTQPDVPRPGQRPSRVRAAFEELLAASRALSDSGRPADAAETLARATALVRGPLAEGTESRGIELERDRFQERRVSAQEELYALEVSLGQGERHLPELVRLISEHPLRERPHALLMRTLADSGRQVEALDA